MPDYVEKLQVGTGEAWPISATKMANSRTFKVNLASTSAASFDGTADATPGVTGTLPLANGGLGANNAADARGKLGLAYGTLFPIGYIYMSVDATSPASMFGGTWEQITNRFLLAAGSTYAAGSTGGEATHKLTETEAPYKKYGMGVRPFDYGSNTDKTVYGHTNVTTSHLNDWGNWYGLQSSGYNRSYYTWITWNYGGDGAHNNMPPYLAVYVWKRVG